MKKWTEEEIKYLLSLDRNNLDLYCIAEALNRSVGSVCRKIKRLFKKDLRHKIIGSKRRAVNHYNLILNRINNCQIKKNLCYKNIKMLIPKDKFIEWFMKNDFMNASVDRIDNKKDYSIDNIQLIPLTENIRKDKLKSKDGLCRCYMCGEIKPIQEFSVDKKRLNGHSTLCKKCDNNRKTKRS